MTFTNSVVGNGGSLVREAIKSPDFATGTTGWTINKDGSAEFNDLTVRGEFLGAAFVLNSTGLYFYDPTPGPGNLIGSWTNSDGVDEYGNTVFGGVTSYAGQEYVQMAIGNLTLGTFGAGTTGNNPGEVSILGGSNAIVLQSATNTSLPNPSFITIAGGDQSTGTGNATFPHTELSHDVWVHQNTTTPTLSGSLIASVTPAGTGTSQPETWHVPTIGTGWANGTGIGGSYPNLQWRRDPMNNIHINGVFHATSTSPGTLVASGLPGVNGSTVSPAGAAVKMVSTNGGTAPGTMALYVNMNGELRIQGIPATVANDTYMVNAIVPLRYIP